ncbi:NAD-dependent epimerase/dehydratase family protein [Nocardioides daphniae]|uniref:NAD-dependent epimerase/dehydratase family protein n=1 Tax=Nocardioides daphniae TaxID=402297 RepID=A0A4P7UBG7_9ACTN|nr:NAD-dependent epimerase/dehydratase family protein [Nocardioides daphniae]
MRVVIAGSSGFLGTHLLRLLRSHGHQVSALVRRPPGPDEIQWDPYAGPLDPAALQGAHVVVNLAGAPTMGNPHSEKWARALRESRVTTTAVLAEAIAACERPPAFLAGNGISWYGDHGDDPVTEQSDSRGDALLTRVTREWEAATAPPSRLARGSACCGRHRCSTAAPLRSTCWRRSSGPAWEPASARASSTSRSSRCATGPLRPPSWPSRATSPGPSTSPPP